MVEMQLKPDPRRSGWYIAEEVQTLSPTPTRWRMPVRVHVWRPPTDVYETADAIVVRMEIAGMQEEDFTISLSDRALEIRGVRPDVPERRAYHQMEIIFGEFVSEVELPSPVSVEKAEAEYRAGFLRLVLPKEQPQKIQIKS